jgi:hypothetical protein
MRGISKMKKEYGDLNGRKCKQCEAVVEPALFLTEKQNFRSYRHGIT